MQTEVELGRTHVDSYLQHYASPYYDPVKAKEYYERTKKLKGRRSTSGMGENRRNAWNYTKTQIGEARKAETKKASADQRSATQRAAAARKLELENRRKAQVARVEKIRQSAKETRERIEKKLSDKLASLEQATAIPENASPKLREFLMKQRARQSQSAREAASATMKTLAPKLKSALETARKDYENSTNQLRAKHDADRKAQKSQFDAAKKARDQKYEQTLDREFEGIRDNVKDAPKKRSSKKT